MTLKVADTLQKIDCYCFRSAAHQVCLQKTGKLTNHLSRVNQNALNTKFLYLLTKITNKIYYKVFTNRSINFDKQWMENERLNLSSKSLVQKNFSRNNLHKVVKDVLDFSNRSF